MYSRFIPTLIFLLASGTTLLAQAIVAAEMPVGTTAAATPLIPAKPYELSLYLAAKVEYPDLAREYCIEGTTIVEVMVDELGDVDILGVVRPLFPACDSAAVAAVRELPRLQPAVGDDGLPISRRFYLPFRFGLR